MTCACACMYACMCVQRCTLYYMVYYVFYCMVRCWVLFSFSCLFAFTAPYCTCACSTAASYCASPFALACLTQKPPRAVQLAAFPPFRLPSFLFHFHFHASYRPVTLRTHYALAPATVAARLAFLDLSSARRQPEPQLLHQFFIYFVRHMRHVCCVHLPSAQAPITQQHY